MIRLLYSKNHSIFQGYEDSVKTEIFAKESFSQKGNFGSFCDRIQLAISSDSSSLNATFSWWWEYDNFSNEGVLIFFETSWI